LGLGSTTAPPEEAAGNAALRISLEISPINLKKK
jgi:hypothetical protein